VYMFIAVVSGTFTHSKVQDIHMNQDKEGSSRRAPIICRLTSIFFAATMQRPRSETHSQRLPRS